MNRVMITGEKIDVAGIMGNLQSNTDGAFSMFLGNVRQSSSAKDRPGSVVRLEYEAYAPMAEKVMSEILDESMEKFSISGAIMHHRIGTLTVGETAVCIAVGSPHRAAAFEACRYLIEELKQRVPIWKKEVFEDGAEWVDPRP